MARKGLLVVMVLLAVLMVNATIAQAQGNPPQGPTYVGSDDTKETHQYPLGYTPGGDLSKANWQPFVPTGVVTDANWWVDGHAKQHRQQYLEWLPSAHAAALDALKKPEAGGQDVCVKCHSADTGDIATYDWKIAMPGRAEKGEPSACSACHINDQSKAMQLPAEMPQKMIDDRQKEIGDKITALEGRLKAVGEKNIWLDAKTQAPVDAAPDGFKAAFTNVSFVKADGSKGSHNYPYAQAILAQADSDLKNIEQPLTPTPLPPTPVPPTPVAPRQPTAAPTVDVALRAAPGVNWLIWIGLAAIVVAVLVMLMTRKPKAS